MLCIAYGVKIIFFIAGLPLNVPSIRNYLFLLQHILNRAVVLLDVADLLLSIPSNRNQLCPLRNAFNWPKIMFIVTGTLLNIPSTRNHSLSFSSSSQHGQNRIGCCWPPSDYSIHQESFLLLHAMFQMVRLLLCDADFLKTFDPPGITSLFYMDSAICSIQQAASFSQTLFYHWFLS